MRLGSNLVTAVILSVQSVASYGVRADPALATIHTRPATGTMDLWTLAHRYTHILRFSTLFTAQNVRDCLSSPQGISKAIEWCKDTGVTHVYLETFRSGYTAQKETLLEAKQKFAEAGFLVSGCVTTTGLGRKSVRGWLFPCLSDSASLDNLKRIFEYTAGLFDEIMIDDFLATKCECDECVKARGDRSWSQFRCDLLVDVSRRYIIQPAHKINPKVKIIIKYPNWYEDFHTRGYEAVRQTQMFDKIWVGTETRDPDNKRWGRKSQYGAYFIMRWLGAIGGDKCGGGWFDPYGTSPSTYVEQARQTILAGAKQAFLFCYGSLQHDTGSANVQALRQELPQLFQLAELVRGKTVRGISAPKPPNSDGQGDQHIYDFVGLLGLPLVPTTEVCQEVPAALLGVQALKDPELAGKLDKMLKANTPLLLTNHLIDKLPKSLDLNRGNMEVLDVPGDRWSLMDLPPERLRTIRKRLLAPFHIEFDAPSRVALYLFGSDLVIIENFNDRLISAALRMENAAGPKLTLVIPAGDINLLAEPGSAKVQLPPRSLVALSFSH